MHNSMTLEGNSRDELFATNVTFEWLHSSVPSHVRLQLQLCAKSFLTFITFEGLVSCVYSLWDMILC